MSTDKDTGDEALRRRCEDQLRSTSCYNHAMIEELAGYMVEQIREEVKAELSRAGGEMEQLRRQLAAVEADWNKAKHGHRGTCAELERTRGEVERLRRQLADVEAARAKAMPQGSFWEQMCHVQFHGDGMIYRGTACAIAREADTVIAAQADELERLRNLERGIRVAARDSSALDELDARVLAVLEEFDRAPAPPVPQAEPQPSGEGTER